MPTRRVSTRAVPAPVRRLDLALQGGGSHGAFTWGVLDRLLDEPSIELASLSGTSAGALNAAVLATGWADGGRRGAQAALRAFWLDVASSGPCFGRGLAALPWASATAPGLAAHDLHRQPWYAWTQGFLRAWSPYQFNPGGDSPLRPVVERHVRQQALRDGPLALFVTATVVATGRPRVFDRQDLSVDALLASACLPQLFRAVVIDGQALWDGGYSGNPALWPLSYRSGVLDLLLVKTSPLVRPDLPDTADEIADRVNEVTFNAGLVGELRAIAFVQKLLAEGAVAAGPYKPLRLHLIDDERGLSPLHPSTKTNTDCAFLEALHALGHAAAGRWWETGGAAIGVRGTFDPRDFFDDRRRLLA